MRAWAYAALVGIAFIIASSAEAVPTSKRPFVEGVYVGKGSSIASNGLRIWTEQWDLHAERSDLVREHAPDHEPPRL